MQKHPGNRCAICGERIQITHADNSWSFLILRDTAPNGVAYFKGRAEFAHKVCPSTPEEQV